MSARLLLAASAATGALLAAAPATAQSGPDMPYEEGAYDYAQDGPVVYRDAPVVQALPDRIRRESPRNAGVDYDTQYRDERDPYAAPYAAPYPGEYRRAPAPVRQNPVAVPYSQAEYGSPYANPYVGQFPQQFDRNAWLADCRAQYGDGRRQEKGGILGSLIGAIAGGVIGNRVYDSERLAGSLIGAGVGGLAGLAIGSAIGSSKDRRARDECEYTLDRYMSGGYDDRYYRQGYTMMPVTVAIPQRAVIREYITYETIEERGYVSEPVVQQSREPVYIKQRPTKRTRYIKGN